MECKQFRYQTGPGFAVSCTRFTEEEPKATPEISYLTPLFSTHLLFFTKWLFSYHFAGKETSIRKQRTMWHFKGYADSMAISKMADKFLRFPLSQLSYKLEIHGERKIHESPEFRVRRKNKRKFHASDQEQI